VIASDIAHPPDYADYNFDADAVIQELETGLEEATLLLGPDALRFVELAPPLRADVLLAREPTQIVVGTEFIMFVFHFFSPVLGPELVLDTGVEMRHIGYIT
jgi:hypothetical protein